MRHNKMLKNIFAGVICFTFLFICSKTVFAADSTVTYSTNSKKFAFSPENTDLFQNFKGIMPGDSVSQTFAVLNDQKYGVRINMYLRAKPVEGADETETQKYNKFLSQLTLTVTQDGKPYPLFDDKANTQATLKENVLLGTFYPGDKTNFNVNLKVPLEMGNEFQDTSGKITWIFTAEERPYYPPPDPQPYNPSTVDPLPSDPKDETVIIEDELTPLGKGPNLQTIVKNKSPTTGDSANIILPIILMIIAAAVIVLLFVTRKKKRNDKHDIK